MISNLLVELFKGNDVDTNAIDEYGRTPLSWAARSRHEAIIKLLLNTSKAEAKSEDSSG